MPIENSVLLNEIDLCSLQEAHRNNSGFIKNLIKEMREPLGEKACREFLKKLNSPVLLTLVNNPIQAFFFATLAKEEVKRLIDDPVVKCKHTTQEHIQSLLFIIDSLDGNQN